MPALILGGPTIRTRRSPLVWIIYIVHVIPAARIGQASRPTARMALEAGAEEVEKRGDVYLMERRACIMRRPGCLMLTQSGRSGDFLCSYFIFAFYLWNISSTSSLFPCCTRMASLLVLQYCSASAARTSRA
ncbi:uncharacterized protein BDZ99DRAFT_220711 [Mytilinidion resinicola]|uniref:Uncharacterized protein n=1 Tax=Mytilinidion resinicola TaxID=574789 RepID=A0A6A6XYT1_9PEZI|nr:uncharacterized protein BDZ99DRAFT_220711 [Mytilinidion resinicola]KAF2801438.1 hypothetical protein BDZ99DRAFT_220711 [Mytilinidion resinicola]